MESRYSETSAITVSMIPPEVMLDALKNPTSTPSSCAAFVHAKAAANTSGEGNRVSRAMSASMHHRMMLATIDPSWANALTIPPAAFQSIGRRRKPAAESGKAIL